MTARNLEIYFRTYRLSSTTVNAEKTEHYHGAINAIVIQEIQRQLFFTLFGQARNKRYICTRKRKQFYKKYIAGWSSGSSSGS